ncbi:putative bifunctional diguanylate cyclase/phosphodiesterase [Kineococcus glutinatus]|uniref:EAL domain-containing protein n=1 Tax=Kineococcus glutinatus TaxID=1070872 RepID=A0ABP9HGN5_9ACTN
MTDRERGDGAATGAGASAAAVLAAVLAGLDAHGSAMVSVLEPVRDAAGDLTDFRVLAINDRWADGHGHDLVGRRLTEVVRPERLARQLGLSRAAFEADGPVHREEEFLEEPVGLRVGEVTRTRVGDLLVVVWNDVTAARAAEAERTATEQRFRTLVEHSSDVIAIVRPDRSVAYASPAATRLLFGENEDGRSVTDLRYGDPIVPQDLERTLDLFQRTCAAPPGEVLRDRVRVVAAGGRTRWLDVRASNHLDTPGVAGVVLNMIDVTEERLAREQLAHQAVHDSLTGLPNRRYLTEALQHAIARGSRTGHALAVLVVDVDHFKHVNDAYGHPTGDQLLVAVTGRLRAAVRPADTVCRFGGDEFVVLAEDLHHPDDALVLAKRLTAGVTGSYPLDAADVHVTLSVGVSTTTGDGTPDSLLSNADHALYEAKRRGRDRVEVFRPELREHLVERLAVERDLRRALEGEEFELYWQPIVRTRDGAVTGVEALLRWHHPERGLLAPGAFLHVAEEAGLMPVLCARVLQEAIGRCATWSRQLPSPPRVFVNLDRHQVRNPGLVRGIGELLDRHGVDPALLTLEISERLLGEDVPHVRSLLQRIRGHGIGVALDDFGAGNTALSWLQEFPIDLLKLDLAFTAALGQPATRAIVEAVLALAPRLGIATLAEGVETREQLATLVELGCDYTQGFLHARPRSAEQLTAELLRG